MTTEQKEFKKIIDSINNNKLRAIALEAYTRIPKYFWHAPASSSGKYHPEYSLGDGGVARHTLSAYWYLMNLATTNKQSYLVEMTNSAPVEDAHYIDGIYKKIKDFDISQKTRETMAVAILFHDTRKSGTQAEYKLDKNTKFLHPVFAADVFLKIGREHPEWYIECHHIAGLIMTHMGIWTKSNYTTATLTKPHTKGQLLVHLADYLASRKYLARCESIQ